MAEENQNKYEETTATNSETEIKDRGVFDFLGGKKKDEEHKPQEEAIATDFNHKVTLYEAPSETKVEEKEEGEKKHTSLLEKLHRSDSSSSSVSTCFFIKYVSSGRVALLTLHNSSVIQYLSF